MSKMTTKYKVGSIVDSLNRRWHKPNELMLIQNGGSTEKLSNTTTT